VGYREIAETPGQQDLKGLRGIRVIKVIRATLVTRVYLDCKAPQAQLAQPARKV
jgi:hypothetical protein